MAASAFASAFVFLGPCAFPFNVAQIRFCEAALVFRVGTDRFVAAPGSLARTIASSSGDKLRAQARIVLRRSPEAKKRRSSEMDTTKRARLRPGRDGRRVSNRFAVQRCLRAKSSNMGTDRLLSRRTDNIPAENARVIQTAERQQSGRWQTESRFVYQAIHRRLRSSPVSGRTTAYAEIGRCPKRRSKNKRTIFLGS